MINHMDFEIPVLSFIERRGKYIEGAKEWEWLIADPVVGRLAPAAYLLARQGALRVPTDVRQELQKLYWRNKAQWMVRESHLKRVLGELAQAEVAVIPLKGAAFLGSLYKDIGLRGMSDIDILVRPKDFLRAVGMLEKLGFTACLHDERKTLQWLESLPTVQLPSEISMSNGHGLGIDIHQELVSPWFRPAYQVEGDELWGRSIPGPGARQGDGIDEEIPWSRFLSPDDTLGYLCLHEALHGMRFLQGYVDADQWMRSLPEGWGWEGFIQLVNEWQIRSAAYHLLSFCRVFMDTPLPEGLLEWLDPGRLARWRVRMLITAESLLRDEKTPGRRYPTLVKLALIDSIPKMIKTLFHLAFPGRSYYRQNPSRGNLLANWRHILEVVRRGE